MEPLRPDDSRQVGPYRWERRLGAGGMGQLFLAARTIGGFSAAQVVDADPNANPPRKHNLNEIRSALRWFAGDRYVEQLK